MSVVFRSRHLVFSVFLWCRAFLLHWPQVIMAVSLITTLTLAWLGSNMIETVWICFFCRFGFFSLACRSKISKFMTHPVFGDVELTGVKFISNLFFSFLLSQNIDQIWYQSFVCTVQKLASYECLSSSDPELQDVEPIICKRSQKFADVMNP